MCSKYWWLVKLSAYTGAQRRTPSASSPGDSLSATLKIRVTRQVSSQLGLSGCLRPMVIGLRVVRFSAAANAAKSEQVMEYLPLSLASSRPRVQLARGCNSPEGATRPRVQLARGSNSSHCWPVRHRSMNSGWSATSADQELRARAALPGSPLFSPWCRSRSGLHLRSCSRC